MFKLPDLRRGDDRSVLVGVTLGSGTLVGSQSIKCTIKNALTDDDTAALMQLSVADGTIEVVDATTLRLIFGHAATAGLGKQGNKYVDIQVVSSDGEVITVDNLDIRVFVKPDVTLTAP